MATGAEMLPGQSRAGVLLTQKYGSENGQLQVLPEITESYKVMVRNYMLWMPYLSSPASPGLGNWIPG